MGRFRTDREIVPPEPLPEGFWRSSPLSIITGGTSEHAHEISRRLVEAASRREVVAVVEPPIFSAEHLVERLLEIYGVVSSDEAPSRRRAGLSLERLAAPLSQFLKNLASIGLTPILVLVDAQALPLAALEYVQTLSAFSAAETPLLRIVLIGTSRLREQLASPSFAELNARATLQHKLPSERGWRFFNRRISLTAAVWAAVVASGLAALITAVIYERLGF